jgi:galactose mutarotase-like enzyme
MMQLYSDRHFGCRVNEYGWRGHRLIVLENELLRVGVVASKGADILELRYKPRDVDFLWRSPHPLLPPAEYVPTSAAPLGAFLDYYPGGWQESLPAGNGAPTWQGAPLGLHGEVATMPWEVSLEQDEPERVAVRFAVRARRTPFWLRRTMALERETPYVSLDEILVNEGEEPAAYMWGHHVAFGPPFLAAGCILEAPAAPVVVPEGMPHGRYQPGRYDRWPWLRDRDGRPIDASRAPGKEARVADTLYLADLATGYAAVRNHDLGLGVGLEWETQVFPYLWSWQAYGGAWGYPYYGRTYHVALEPFNAPIGTLEDALRSGTGGNLAPGAHARTTLRAGAIAGDAPFTGFLGGGPSPGS